MNTPRPALHHPSADGTAAVERLIDHLQRGFDSGDADIYDGMFAGDVLWGTPKGVVLQGYDTLNAIHRRMMNGTPLEPASHFDLMQLVEPVVGVVVAQIKRTALNGGFSEMAMYVLAKHGDRWWLTAGQNTPVVDQLPGRIDATS